MPLKFDIYPSITMNWKEELPLKGHVAVVTGASRSTGRGIACVLGEAGATVYVTGRSVRGHPLLKQYPTTIQDTAEEVTRRGGKGIAVRCDHTNDSDVKHLFGKVKREQDHLDILVNNVWGDTCFTRNMVNGSGCPSGNNLWSAGRECSLREYALML
jgi:enoyl-[acyl-carrier-protein] reductase (NADH)